jgi:hypothetical protein
MATKKPVKKAKAKKPAEKPVELLITKGVITKVESSEAPAAESTKVEVAVEPKKIDLNKEPIKGAIAQGLELIHSGKSKADAARAIFGVLNNEQKEVIVAAFVAGATLTEKGALTYWYNCKRKAKKEAGAAS